MTIKTTFTDRDKTMLGMGKENSSKCLKEKIITSTLMLLVQRRTKEDKRLKKHNEMIL